VHRISTLSVVCILFISPNVQADLRELVPENVLKQIAGETSGEEAKRNLDTLTLYHRMRASAQFGEASSHVLRELQHYGMDEAGIIEFPADGETMFGTQKSRPEWRVDFAELWELTDKDRALVRRRRLASWDALPLSLAQDSLSGEVTTTLVDVGAGTSDDDYAGKDVEGRLVLTSSQPGDIVELAVGRLGAAGIVSYAPNQKSAWWKQDDRLVRWGHMGSFPKTKSFAFMISLREARSLQLRLAEGESTLFHAKVIAEHRAGKYSFTNAAISGADPQQVSEEIILTCHMDHPRPGANDNASGCVSILEVARTLKTLIDAKILPRPARTIRFLWPAEIEGSIIYLVEHPDPDRIKANIHMDMVGGAPETKAVFRISGGPTSLPTFIADVGHEIGHFVNAQTEAFAGGADVDFALDSPEGGKEPLLALMEGIDMGSDHDVFREGSWRIPGLYVHDCPDRYIHTNFDTSAMIDPTKLKRAAFIGAVSAYFLANMSEGDVPAVLTLLRRNALKRSAELLERRRQLDPVDAAIVTDIQWQVERGKLNSISEFAALSDPDRRVATQFLRNLAGLIASPSSENRAPGDDTVYERNPAIRGPMSAFGYSYLTDKYTGERYEKLRLPKHTGTHGTAGEYDYEALNLVNGTRNVSDIRNWLTAELGPVPTEYVSEYLQALESVGVIRVRD
jgi:hypothetical protein